MAKEKIRFDTKEPKQQRGSALLMALFVLTLLGSTGVALLFMTRTEIQMSQTNLDVKQSFYLAEAGQEDGRATLHAINGTNVFTDALEDYAGANDRFDFDPDLLQIVYDADGNATGLSGFGDDQPLQGITRLASGWYAAFVTNDPLDGVINTTDTNDLVMITGIGGGPGRKLEIVQAIVERWEVMTEVPPATITLLGPNPDFYGGSADPHTYHGNDCAGDGSTGYVPVVGLVGSSAEALAETGIRYDEVTGEGPEYIAGPYVREETFVDLTDPTEPILVDNNYGGMDPRWTDCLAMHEIVEDFRDAATTVCCTAPVCDPEPPCTIPAPSMNNTIFIDGDFEINPPGGQGTLVVTGEVIWDGRASWEGSIYAFGAGRFRQNGAGNGIISGSIMVANIAGPDGIYGNEDDCTVGDGFDSAHFDLRGGGNADTAYCSVHINDAKPNPPYRIVNFRQL